MIKDRGFTRREETEFYDKLNLLFNSSKCPDALIEIHQTSFWNKCKGEFNDSILEFVLSNKEDVVDEFKIDESEFAHLIENIKIYE